MFESKDAASGGFQGLDRAIGSFLGGAGNRLPEVAHFLEVHSVDLPTRSQAQHHTIMLD